MNCPICGGAMDSATEAFPNASRLHWCPRCGTLRTVFADGRTADTAPLLVGRCREFEGAHMVGLSPHDDRTYAAEGWKRLGIAESINLPGDRPS